MQNHTNVKRAVMLLLLYSSGCTLSHSDSSPVAAEVAITNVNVVDVRNGSLRPNRTVLISGNRISGIGPSHRIRVPPGARVVNATGLYLIPGLWDMHTHALDPDRSGVFLPVFVANGVTGIRDMHTRLDWAQVSEVKQDIATGRRVGPRIKATGPQIDARDAATPDEARRAVNARADGGADFIKVSSVLSREGYLAVADQARRRRLPLVGHVPFSVGAFDAADAGHQSMEHLFGILLACSSRENELRNEAVAALADPNPPAELYSRLLFALQTDALLQTYTSAKCERLFERFRTRGTWQVPTLIVLKTGACQDDAATTDRRLQYVPLTIRSGWQRTCARRLAAYTDENLASRRRQFQKELELVSALHRSGVPILAGSDVPNAYVFPGFSLHNELELLVEAGLSPSQALQAATLNPARYLGLSAELGTVENGKVADLVLLEGDPLNDIRNTQRIRAVIVDGDLFERAALDRLLRNAAAEAARE